MSRRKVSEPMFKSNLEEICIRRNRETGKYSLDIKTEGNDFDGDNVYYGALRAQAILTHILDETGNTSYRQMGDTVVGYAPSKKLLEAMDKMGKSITETAASTIPMGIPLGKDDWTKASIGDVANLYFELFEEA